MTNPIIRTVQGKRVIRRAWTGKVGSSCFNCAFGQAVRSPGRKFEHVTCTLNVTLAGHHCGIDLFEEVPADESDN